MVVENGSKTLFWDHCWAVEQPLNTMTITPIPLYMVGSTVESMWEHGSGWKWELISPYLHPDILKRIQAYELKNDPDAGDLVFWKDGDKGRFSIRSAVSIMRHESDVLDDDCWAAIWRAPLQQRIRAFLWVACHDRVLGNLNRFKRKMTSNPSCFICGTHEESTLHILRDCPHARMVWNKVGGPATSHHFFQGRLKD